MDLYSSTLYSAGLDTEFIFSTNLYVWFVKSNPNKKRPPQNLTRIIGQAAQKINQKLPKPVINYSFS